MRALGRMKFREPYRFVDLEKNAEIEDGALLP